MGMWEAGRAGEAGRAAKVGWGALYNITCGMMFGLVAITQ